MSSNIVKNYKKKGYFRFVVNLLIIYFLARGIIDILASIGGFYAFENVCKINNGKYSQKTYFNRECLYEGLKFKNYDSFTDYVLNTKGVLKLK